MKETKTITDLLNISDSDKQRLRRDEVRHPIVKYLKNKENMAFNIGDVLIKKIKKYTGPHTAEHWVTEMTSPHSKIPRKYIYLFENEWEVGYIKRLKADGTGTCGPLMCVADVEFSWIKYEVDPEYSDHIILGEVEKYNYNERFKKEKEERQEIHKYNRSILVSTKSQDILNERIRMMKPGQRFWYNEDGIGISNLQDMEYEVVEVIKNNINKNAVKIKYVGPPSFSSINSGAILYAQDFMYKALTFTRPKSMKDIYG